MKAFSKFRRRAILTAVTAVLLLTLAVSAGAFLDGSYGLRGTENIKINLMFDNLSGGISSQNTPLDNYRKSLDQKELGIQLTANPDDLINQWGHIGNPFVISNDQHLKNLAFLQNRGRIDQMFANSDPAKANSLENMPCFVISTPEYTPAVVGDVTIRPVGTPEYPFKGLISGVTGDPVALGSGVTTTTSAVHNVTISGTDGTPDIGFFGEISCSGDPGGKFIPSHLENIVFSDVKLRPDGGIFQGAHDWFKNLFSGEAAKDPGETHHLGIIAGHVRYSSAKNLSVYYSSPSQTAVQLDGNSEKNYFCGTGFFGILDHLNPDRAADGSGIPGTGQNDSDFGGSGSDTDQSGDQPGYIRAEKMFGYRPQGVGPHDSVPMQSLVDKTGRQLAVPSYDANLNPVPSRRYIYDGVFAFTLSENQNDSIEDIWPERVEVETASLDTILTRMNLMTQAPVEQEQPAPEQPVPEPLRSPQVSAAPETTEPDRTEATEAPTEAPTEIPVEIPDPVEILVEKLPEDLKLTIWQEEPSGEKKPMLSLYEEALALYEAEKPLSEAQIAMLTAQEPVPEENIYTLLPGEYHFSASCLGYTPIENGKLRVLAPRKDENGIPEETKLKIILDPAPEPAETAPATEPTQETAASTEALTEPTVTVETEPVPDPTVQGETVAKVPSKASALPTLYFGGMLTAAPAEPTETTAPAETTEATETAATEELVPAAPQKPEPQAAPAGPSRAETNYSRVICTPNNTVFELYGNDWQSGHVTEAKKIPSVKKEIKGNTVIYYYNVNGSNYEFTAEAPGYLKKNGEEFAIWNNPWTHQVDLQPDPNAPKPVDVTFTCSPSGLKVTIEKQNGKNWTEVQTISGNQTVKLLPGNYRYTASAEGYKEITRPFKVQKSTPQTIQIQLEPLVKTAVVSFQSTTENIQLTVRDAQGKTYEPVNGVYALPAGDYTYTATAPGYQPLENQIFTVTAEDTTAGQKTVQLPALTPLPTAATTFTFGDAQGAVIVVKDSGSNEISPVDGVYKLVQGSYTYSVRCPGYMPIVDAVLQVTQEHTNTGTLSVPVTLEKGAEVTFRCDPADLILTLKREGQKVPRDPRNPNVYYLTAGSYTWEASCPNYDRKTGTLTVDADLQPQTVSVKLKSNGKVPLGKFRLPTLDPIVSKGGPDTIKLYNTQGAWEYTEEGLGDTGEYYIYLQEVTSLPGPNDPDSANNRYFICANGFEGSSGRMAYLDVRLGAAGEPVTYELYSADSDPNCTVTYPVNSWDPAQGDKPGMILAYPTPEDRMEGLLSMGMQIVQQPGGKYNLYQSSLDPQKNVWVPTGYLGLAYENGRSIITLSPDKEQVPKGMKKSIYSIGLQYNGGWSIKAGSGQGLSYIHDNSTGDNMFKVNGSGEMKFRIFRVSGYGAAKKPVKQWTKPGQLFGEFPADQYVLWGEPEVKTGDTVRNTVDDMVYELVSIDDLGAKGWKISSGATMSSQNYHPQKMFNIEESVIREGAWTNNKTVSIPLKRSGQALKPGEKPPKESLVEVPTSTLSYYVNKTGGNPYVRILEKIPVLPGIYNGAAYDRVNGCRLGVWQVSNGYWVNKPRMAVPVPISQKMDAGHRSVFKVRYQGTVYQCCLQGETVLLATEFEQNKMKLEGTIPAFFVTQTKYPMQPVYCAAEGVAGEGGGVDPEANSGSIDSIDFVYDIGKAVIPVTDGQYIRSNQLLHFESFNPEGGGFAKVNTGAASLQRLYGNGKPVLEHSLSPNMSFAKTGDPADTTKPIP